MISMIVAMGKDRQIGLKNSIPWHLPEDLKNFKKITLGHHLLMGRKTYESIGRPLPGRTTLLLTKNREKYSYLEGPTCKLVEDFEQAFAFAKEKNETEFFICGGGEIYKGLLSKVQKIYLSTVQYDGPADAYFPQLDFSKWDQQEKIVHENWIYEVWKKH